MENNNIENLSSLSENGACKKRRMYKKIVKNNIKPSFEKSPVLMRSVIIKDTIKNCLIYNEKDRENIMNYMNSRYIECGFINPQQKMQILLGDWERVMRYIESENRFAKLCSAKKIKIDDNLDPILVKPDIAFPIGDQIDLVYFKIGKPNVSQKGEKNKFKRDLQLYATILYGRKLGFKNIRASFYFLKKNTDNSSNKSVNDVNFFGDGGNIVTMTDYYNEEANDLDDDINALINKYKDGIEEDDQDEDTCKYCDYYNVCKYKKAPVQMNEEN